MSYYTESYYTEHCYFDERYDYKYVTIDYTKFKGQEYRRVEYDGEVMKSYDEVQDCEYHGRIRNEDEDVISVEACTCHYPGEDRIFTLCTIFFSIAGNMRPIRYFSIERVIYEDEPKGTPIRRILNNFFSEGELRYEGKHKLKYKHLKNAVNYLYNEDWGKLF